MNRNRYRDVGRSEYADALACPDCSERLRPEGLECRNCGTVAVERNGVVSLRPDVEERSDWLSDRELDEFARSTANGSIRDAAREAAAGNDRRAELLEEVFDVQRELWQPLVAEHVGGRCLDLYAGYGRRSMVLAERADSVCAVDPSLQKLRIAAGRDDYAGSERVLPVHATAERLPFQHGSFETIFADLAGSDDVRSTLVELQKYLSADGSLLFLADGWTRTGGVTDLLGEDRNRSSSGGGLRPGTATGYRSLAQSIGFDDVTVYALVPTASRPLYAFDVECEEAIPTIFESYARHRGVVGSCIKEVMKILTKTGVLKKCYPSFLIACSNDPKPPAFKFTNPVVVSGRTRSVVLDMGADGVEEIYKVPNRADHAPFTERENRLTSALRSEPASISSTIPGGETVGSELGPARRVRPVAGRPLDEAVGRDAESLERVLRIGFDWLAEFHRSLGGDPIRKSPTEIREDLRFAPANVAPPAIDERLKTFTTPVHGDFMSSNIYYENGEITSVIDWEYGARAASPVVDAGYLLLNTAAWAVGDFEERVRTVLCGRNEYARRARECVREYCDAVGLPYRTFELYLPAAYLHQLSIDWRLDSVSTYTTRSEEQVRRVEALFDVIDEMNIS